MSGNEMEIPPPMDEDVEQMLRAERARPPLNSARTERMWRAVTEELALLQTGGAGGVGGPAAGHQSSTSLSAAKPTGLTIAPTPIGPAATTTTSAPSVLSHLAVMLKGHLAWVAVSFGLGSVGGVVAGHQMSVGFRHAVDGSTTQAARLPAREVPPAPSPLPSASNSEEPLSMSPVAATSAVPEVRPPGLPKALGRPRDATLAGERAMLEQAESALRRGDWSTALQQTEVYARRFPRGELTEENLYLARRACLQGGDPVGAHARLEELRRRFPHSALLQLAK